MYRLQFEPNDLGRKRYEICFQAIALTQKQLQTADWDDCISLVRAIKRIGQEAKERVGALRLYDLKEEGGQAFLERSEHKLLVDLVGQPIWRPLGIEDAMEVKKWLESLKSEPKLTDKVVGEIEHKVLADG